MSAHVIGTHLAGESVIHRLSAGTKLTALVVVGVALAVVDGWISAVIALAAAATCVVLARLPWVVLAGSLRGLTVIALTLGGWLTLQTGWERAVATVGDLLALVLLATVVTTTTPVDSMLDVVEEALSPLRPWGLRPERVALACSLVLRTIPVTIGLAEETRDAARARGLERDPRARLTPFVLRVVADAHATGEALHARGVGDD
ncbi:CbiQ family ECF transporter T component [Janibacter anophelis]|uniref:CbiQ family ECF transporter T component n=1 Tax=Janibacter anophelis TaxID=319054 RepID=UPI0009FC89B2|nr:CbiQ family ECF transporter T component [Janibacter anophelis]